MRQLDSPSRSFHRPGGRSNRGGVDALRLQLATLRRREAQIALSQRDECETLLARAVQIRNERRELQTELQRCERGSSSATGRSEAVNERMEVELRMEQRAMDHARHELSRVEEAEERLGTESARNINAQSASLREEGEKYDKAARASDELSERLEERWEGVEAEIDELRQAQSRLEVEVPDVPKETLVRLRENVASLTAKLEIADEECGPEAKRLWLMADSTVARLKIAQGERRRLNHVLLQARWDHDNLKSSYDRIMRGLLEQHEAQHQSMESLREESAASRREAEEMAATIRSNDEALQRAREDQLKAETFVQHLTTQVNRLETERDTLRQKMRDQPAGPALADGSGLSKEANREAAQFLRQDHRRLIDESRAALARDKDEEEGVAEVCELLEVELRRAEQRKGELESEANMVLPLLGGRR
eukprot:TRINITY_DN17542_c0_g2_i1.p1 TRINITY_DN17542_c0_g2~~TRINITY_DN17542_c0_g2_i1.p1  ORF type:complete len:424 (-),score=67.90 TRINITY_DN17542_c0_g2_i1:102-1373(-)